MRGWGRVSRGPSPRWNAASEREDADAQRSWEVRQREILYPFHPTEEQPEGKRETS